MLLGAASAGCGAAAGRRAEPLRMPSDPDRLFSTAPVSARIYPATRFVREGERSWLTLGVELLDGLGDPVKEVGVLRCRLLADPDVSTRPGPRGVLVPAPSPQGEALYAWDVRVATPEEQAEHWDPVSRCYVLELELDDFSVAYRPSRVRVDFEPAQGVPLAAEAAMTSLP